MLLMECLLVIINNILKNISKHEHHDNSVVLFNSIWLWVLIIEILSAYSAKFQRCITLREDNTTETRNFGIVTAKISDIETAGLVYFTYFMVQQYFTT